MAKKKSRNTQQYTLRGVTLSFPELKVAKEFKGNSYFKTDCLIDSDDPQAKKLRALITQVKEAAWGEDKSEWPEGHSTAAVKKGDDREDQKEYAGKLYITATKNAEYGQPPVVDTRGKPFKGNIYGGMVADVAVTIGVWKDGDGASIWLDAVMIDPDADHQNFSGGGVNLKKRFGISATEEEEEESGSKPKKGKGFKMDGDDEEDQPRKDKKKSRQSREEEE